MLTHAYTLEPMRKERKASGKHPFFRVMSTVNGQEEMANVLLNITDEAKVTDIENTEAYSFLFISDIRINNNGKFKKGKLPKTNVSCTL